jgi:hypothetical protein
MKGETRNKNVKAIAVDMRVSGASVDCYERNPRTDHEKDVQLFEQF